LLKLTGPQIEKLDTNWHRSVSPAERLATQLAKRAPSRALVLHFDALIALDVNFARYAAQYGTALLSV